MLKRAVSVDLDGNGKQLIIVENAEFKLTLSGCPLIMPLTKLPVRSIELATVALAGAIRTVAGQQLHAQRDRFGLELT